MAWLEVWAFIDEEGRTRTLAGALWEGQRRFLEALLSDGHVLSIKSRKVGLSTLVCAHAAWTARIRDVNASVHLLSYREDAARELLRGLRRGFDGLPAFLRLPLERETSTVLAYAAGPGDTRSLKHSRPPRRRRSRRPARIWCSMSGRTRSIRRRSGPRSSRPWLPVRARL